MWVSTPASQEPLLGQRSHVFAIQVSTPASQEPLLGQRSHVFAMRFRRYPPGDGHCFAICDPMIRKMKGVFLLRISIICGNGASDAR